MAEAEFTSPTLVTLRLQRQTNSDSDHPQIRIENTSGADSALQVHWQHAWLGGGASAFPLEDGLRNFAHMRTPTDEETENTYVWGVNATSIRAAQRFQLPLKHEDFGWLAATPTGMDISDGEMYFDSVQKGIVMRFASGWYMVQQPERVLTVSSTGTTNWIKGFEKNVVSTGTGSLGAHTVAIGSTDILPGTVVRVFRKKVTAPSLPVTVTASSLTYNISEDRMAEFVFDGSTWLCTQFNVTIK